MSERCDHHFVAEMYGATCEKCDLYLDTDERLMRADFYEAHINEHNRLKAQRDELIDAGIPLASFMRLGNYRNNLVLAHHLENWDALIASIRDEEKEVKE